MILPTFGEMRRIAKRLREEEGIGISTLFRPSEIIRLLIKYRFAHFFVTGVVGLSLGLSVMWILTTFVLGIERYFTAYLLGAAVTLSFNFTVYSLTVFRTTRTHVSRFFVYVFYNVAMTALQATVIKILTPQVGLEWYLAVVLGVVVSFSLLNYIVFKLSLFKERF